jgi:hypothetical protein
MSRWQIYIVSLRRSCSTKYYVIRTRTESDVKLKEYGEKKQFVLIPNILVF